MDGLKMFLVLALMAACVGALPVGTDEEKERIVNMLEKLLSSQKSGVDKRQKASAGMLEFNTCAKETPFPCKKVEACISLVSVCDGTADCADGWDEDTSVCTAYGRVPIETIKDVFISQTWLLKTFFLSTLSSEEDVDLLIHNLAISPTLEDFQERQHLNPEEYNRFRTFLEAIQSRDMQTLHDMGMNGYNREAVEGVFTGFITSGFLN